MQCKKDQMHVSKKDTPIVEQSSTVPIGSTLDTFDPGLHSSIKYAVEKYKKHKVNWIIAVNILQDIRHMEDGYHS